MTIIIFHFEQELTMAKKRSLITQARRKWAGVVSILMLLITVNTHLFSSEVRIVERSIKKEYLEYSAH